MQSTTPLDPRALDAMLPYLTNNFGNPHSRSHLYGWESEDAVEAARAQVASLVGVFFADLHSLAMKKLAMEQQ
jgi:cysteine desulfurase